MRPTGTARPRSRGRRGRPAGSTHVRLRVGRVITMMLSLFGARLFQLQGVDSEAYASARRGLRLDHRPARQARPDPRPQRGAARRVDRRADDRGRPAGPPAAPRRSPRSSPTGCTWTTSTCSTKLTKKDSRFAYVARRIPSTLASSVMDELKKHEYAGVDTRTDPLRTYPAGDVAANLIGFIGDGAPLAGLERTSTSCSPARTAQETYEVGGGNRIPLGDNSQVKPVDGKDLHADHRPGRPVVQPARPARRRSSSPGRRPGAVVLDSRTGECWPSPTTRRSTRTSPARPKERPRLPRAERRLRARLGREGAHRSLAARRRQGHAEHAGSRCPPRCRAWTG